MPDFKPGMLLVLDFMCHYGITVDTQRMIASIEINTTGGTEPAEFPLHSPPGKGLHTTVIRAAADHTIPPKTAMVVRIKGELKTDTDYIFSPE